LPFFVRPVSILLYISSNTYHVWKVQTEDVKHTEIYTGSFTTLGHNCRRWFPKSLWWKKFI